MPAKAMHNNLGEWANEPIIQNQVIAYMQSIDAPMLLREVYRPLRLSKAAVNRVLCRLHAKGILTRYKIPLRRHRPGRMAEPALHDAATRQCYLYSFT